MSKLLGCLGKHDNPGTKTCLFMYLFITKVNVKRRLQLTFKVLTVYATTLIQNTFVFTLVNNTFP